MNKVEIIEILKNSYSRDLRKLMIKTIIEDEKLNVRPDYKIINQIFSYVIKESNWKIANNTQEWNSTPIEIMKETFPKIENTKWLQDQILIAKQIIKAEIES